jgi:hypothetical protein
VHIVVVGLVDLDRRISVAVDLDQCTLVPLISLTLISAPLSCVGLVVQGTSLLSCVGLVGQAHLCCWSC